jgi:fumarate hydratase class II
MIKKKFRIEYDTMGEMSVPFDMYYGAQTARAMENFQISGQRFPAIFIKALGIIKWAAAEANMELKILDKAKGESISKAAQEVLEGKWDDQFVLDIFQTGSGTSANMNANEVIANRAAELLGGKKGDKSLIHPNDDVNKGQSSNDVIPTAMHISIIDASLHLLLPSLRRLEFELESKSSEFAGVIKIGRTHLQDATPIQLGQEFAGYRTMISKSIERIEQALEGIREIALGGTAVGTGINTHPKFAMSAIKKINENTGFGLREADNHFEAQSSKDAVVAYSGSLKGLAVSLMKIANDIRWLASGPRAGIGEIILPELQPGSSIMPGKINPIIPEVVLQVAVQVIGNDAVITTAGFSGNFELNVMMPVMIRNILDSIQLLARSSEAFASKCISGIIANREKCGENIEKSLAMATPLAVKIGYYEAARIAAEAYKTGKTIRETILDRRILSEEDVTEILKIESMITKKKE